MEALQCAIVTEGDNPRDVLSIFSLRFHCGHGGRDGSLKLTGLYHPSVMRRHLGVLLLRRNDFRRFRHLLTRSPVLHHDDGTKEHEDLHLPLRTQTQNQSQPEPFHTTSHIMCWSVDSDYTGSVFTSGGTACLLVDLLATLLLLQEECSTCMFQSAVGTLDTNQVVHSGTLSSAGCLQRDRVPTATSSCKQRSYCYLEIQHVLLLGTTSQKTQRKSRLKSFCCHCPVYVE